MEYHETMWQFTGEVWRRVFGRQLPTLRCNILPSPSGKWWQQQVPPNDGYPPTGKMVKCTLVQALKLCTGRTTHRGSRGIALPFHDHGTREGEGSASRPGRFLPPWKTRYPLSRRLGVSHGWSRQVRKISPPPGFDPRTVQPVASRYTDYATWPTPICRTTRKHTPQESHINLLSV